MNLSTPREIITHKGEEWQVEPFYNIRQKDGSIAHPRSLEAALDMILPEPETQADDMPPCTCADAGDCFVPIGHYADCPQYEQCGAWGGCTLPRGHNTGKADIPENHAPQPDDTPPCYHTAGRCDCARWDSAPQSSPRPLVCQQCGYQGTSDDVHEVQWFKPHQHDDGYALVCIGCRMNKTIASMGL
jgi:hypothetical protein